MNTALENVGTAIDGFGFFYAAIRENLHTGLFRPLCPLNPITASELMRAAALGTASPLVMGRLGNGRLAPSGAAESAIR